jgi:hypothetical protein
VGWLEAGVEGAALGGRGFVGVGCVVGRGGAVEVGGWAAGGVGFWAGDDAAAGAAPAEVGG